MGRNYWMVVQTPENFAITVERGFSIHGMRTRHRRRADRMQPDDRILYYVSGIRKWCAIVVVTSSSFEDHSPIWAPAAPGETFAYRVHTAPEVVLDEDEYIDALEVAPRLEYVKRWAPEDWHLAFLDTLHLIPQRDYRLIEGEMRRTEGRRAPGRRAGTPRRGNGRPHRGGPPSSNGGEAAAQPAAERAEEPTPEPSS